MALWTPPRFRVPLAAGPHSVHPLSIHRPDDRLRSRSFATVRFTAFSASGRAESNEVERRRPCQQGLINPWFWKASWSLSIPLQCILFASFFVVRRYSGSVAVVGFAETLADSGHRRALTNGREQAATPFTTRLRNWLSRATLPVPPSCPCLLPANLLQDEVDGPRAPHAVLLGQLRS